MPILLRLRLLRYYAVYAYHYNGSDSAHEDIMSYYIYAVWQMTGVIYQTNLWVQNLQKKIQCKQPERYQIQHKNKTN